MAEMEYWSWPPRYDHAYRPESGNRYWFPRRETMPAGDRERAIVQKLKAEQDAKQPKGEAPQ